MYTGGLAVLTLVSLAAAGPAASAASAAKTSGAGSIQPLAAARTGSSSWRVRTVLREGNDERTTRQVVDPRAGVDYDLVSTTASLSGPYRLRRTDLGTGSARIGPEFAVSGLSLAAGYLWLYGNVPAQSQSFRLVLYQVSPATLAVVRSWRLTPRESGSANVQLTAGQGHSVWVGFRRTARQISATTGATLASIRVPRGTFVSDVTFSPAHVRLYVSVAGIKSGGADVFEYVARGRLLASTEHDPLPSAGGARLTAVPGGVWASFRTGMMGQTVLLRRSDLGNVPVSGGIYGWPMNATTIYGGGALWLANGNNAIGCIAPNKGIVRHQRTLAQLGGNGELLAVNARSRVVYALGDHGVIAISAPSGCWS
jgi:hypothetical protein